MGTNTARPAGWITKITPGLTVNCQYLKLIDQLFERQFILSPWVREKRMRNQLRLVLKDSLEAG